MPLLLSLELNGFPLVNIKIIVCNHVFKKISNDFSKICKNVSERQRFLSISIIQSNEVDTNFLGKLKKIFHRQVTEGKVFKMKIYF